MEEFRCGACGNLGVVYPEMLEGTAPVKCAACATFIATYGEFKRRADEVLARKRANSPLTGC